MLGGSSNGVNAIRTLEPYLFLSLVSLVCVIPGTILVLRQLSMLADAIGHVLLLGIVIAFSIVGDLQSPWLFVGATLSGVCTVALVEWLQHAKRLKQDAAIGLIFPALFSLGVLFVSMEFRDIHLDVDSVLLGIPEQSLLLQSGYTLLGWKIPQPFLMLCGLLLLQLILFGIFYKETKLALFDRSQAALLGFYPMLLHYGQMTLTSMTAVGVFDAVGPVLLVGLMVLPVITARLCTDRYLPTFVWSATFGITGSVVGVALARNMDSTTAGTVAVVLGCQFFLIWIVQTLQKQRKQSRTLLVG